MKRRILIVALFCVAWTAVSSLSLTHTPLQGGLDLATTALALLLALVAGDLVNRLGVPSITGYVAAGIVLGPISGLLGGALLWDLVALQEAALALLAFGAGTQLDLKGGFRITRTAFSTALLSAIVTFGLTLAAVLGLGPLYALFGTSLQLDGQSALVLALLMLGTSPTVVGWVVARAKAPGEVAALGLTTALCRCALVLIGLVLLGNAEPEALKVTGSLWVTLSGALLLASVIRLVGPRLNERATLMLWVLLSLCPSAVSATGGDPVLTLALAGVLTRHWTPAERRAHIDTGVADLMPPAGLVLFTLLGATFTLPSLSTLPLIAVLLAGRSVSLWLSTRLATRWSHGPEVFQRSGWLLLLPQGSFTLGVLASLSVLLPQTIGGIRSSVELIVALGVLLGPLAARVALSSAGEQGQADGALGEGTAPTPALDLSSEPAHPWRDPMAALVGPDDPGPRAAWAASVQSLVVLRGRIREHIIGERLERLAKVHKTTATLARQILQNTGEALTRCEGTTEQVKLLSDARTTLAEGVRGELASLKSAQLSDAPGLIEHLAEELAPTIRSAPTLLEAPESERHVSWDADDPRWVRTGKLIKRPLRRLQAFLGRPTPVREIPYRRLVRRALAGEMLAALGPIEAIISRAEYKALRRLENHLNEADGVLIEAASRDEGPEALKAWMQERVTQLREASRDARNDILYLAEEPLHRVSEAMAAGLNRLATLSDVAGTFALSEADIRYASVAPIVREAIERSEEDQQAWTRRKEAQVQRTQLGLQLVELEVGLRDLVVGEALGPAVRMHRRVQDLMQHAYTLVKEVKDDIASGAVPQKADAEARVTEELLSDLQRRVGRPLEGLITGLRSGGIIDRLMGALERATAPLPEAIALLNEEAIVALERGFSEVDTPTTVSVRERARTFFDRRVAVSLAEHSRALETSAEEARAGIRDAQRLLALHITRAGAATRLDSPNGEGDEGVHRLTLAALATVVERLEVEITQCSGTSAALMEEIAKTKADAVRDLWTHLHDEAMRPQLEAAVWWLWRYANQWTTRLAEHPTFLRAKSYLQALIGRLRATQDFVEARSAERLTGPTRVREALREIEPGQSTLPYVYGKLFALTPTENDAFVLGRDKELQLLRERANSGGCGAALVLGERGQGRSSLVRVALTQSESKRDVIWLDTQRALRGEDEVIAWMADALGIQDTAPKLEAVAAELNQRAVLIVLDDLESLIARDLGGLKALEALMALIVESQGHAFWMVTCERQVWRLLSALCPIADAFDVTVNLGPLGSDEIREAIERRHRLSGLETRFARPKSSDLKAWLSHLLGRSPADRTFKRLTELTRGNPRSAMHLWQLSLSMPSPTERSVEVALRSALRLHELRTLPTHLTCAIALIYRQARIDRSALEAALGWPPAQVGAAIHALEIAGLITAQSRTDGKSAWSLVPHACEPVRRFLVDQGLVPKRGRAL